MIPISQRCKLHFLLEVFLILLDFLLLFSLNLFYAFHDSNSFFRKVEWSMLDRVTVSLITLYRTFSQVESYFHVLFLNIAVLVIILSLYLLFVKENLLFINFVLKT